MGKAPTDGYEELFLTKAEKGRVDEMGVRGEQRRKVAKGVLGAPVKEHIDRERIEKIVELATSGLEEEDYDRPKDV